MKTFDSEFSENKQHIGISSLAYSIITSDFRRFEYSNQIKSINDFINKIIQNCHSLPFDFYPCNLQTIYEQEAAVHKTKAEISAIIDEKYQSYPCNSIEEKVNKTFTIIKSLHAQLISLSGSYIAEYYNNRVGKYINSILEEYAALPFSKRETIIFIDTITELKDSISTKRTKCITHSNGTQYYFIPYKIVTDNMGMYYYVIGKSLPYNPNFQQEERLCSFRIDRISVGYSNKQLSLSFEEKKTLDDCLRNGDVEYLLGEKTVFEVTFSEAGFQLYKDIFAKRPQYITKSEDNQTKDVTCTFECTERQFKNYFLPFGSVIKDIKPDAMKDTFVEFYQRSYENLSSKKLP